MSHRKYRSADEWKALIEEQLSSGQTGIGFCNERGLSAKTFYKQRKRLGYPGRPVASAPASVGQPAGFVQVQPARSRTVSTSNLILHYRDCQLALPTGTDAAFVVELMRALA